MRKIAINLETQKRNASRSLPVRMSAASKSFTNILSIKQNCRIAGIGKKFDHQFAILVLFLEKKVKCKVEW
jgi:hypothetical protein